MKKIILSVAALFCVTTLFAKPNANTKNYKTYETTDKNAPVVYFIRDIKPENLVKIYKKLGEQGWQASSKNGVKMTTGESNNSNHLRPDFVKELLALNGGVIVECNTAYGGNRDTPEEHERVFVERGYDKVAKFDLLDKKDYMSIPVKGGVNLKEDLVGAGFAAYDSFLVRSHFKGHSMGGFGGAIKNLSIGFASGTSVKKSGKLLIHSGGHSTSSWGGGTQDQFLECMAEAAKAVVDYMAAKKGTGYINVMNRLSVDCDCDGNPAEPDMHDIGILASVDPVALDQACVDLVYTAEDSGSLIERIESRNGIHTLEHAEKIGFGSRKYRLVEIK